MLKALSTEQEQEFITDNALGLWWVDSEWLDPEEALIEKITEKTGWCVSSIKYCENRPHPLTHICKYIGLLTKYPIRSEWGI